MTDIEKLADDCKKAADLYEQSPNLAGPQAIVTLYRVVAKIATLLAEKEGRSDDR